MRPIFQVLIVFFSIVLFILTYYLNHKIKMPNNAILIALAEEFHVTADYLLTGRCCTPNDTSSRAIQLIELLLNKSDTPNSQLFTSDVLAALLAFSLTEK